ncbi:hypothetical protein [Bacillus sp. KH172YL63]|uniref:hypothetical protein n=1 Tax=Bacillus sp. KH172YL63 TaxID=2709784 RepID=UPI0013E41B5D|nr:hypothetical protein [Bacillus sp. KH172YL63]BCB03469.1 hypothetical protein KH172YL63_16020 [Bacillus sp. KH172YL63]
MSDRNEEIELTLFPSIMQTSDELIDWVLSVLSSNHLTEEQLLSWWKKEVQFVIPHKEEK